MREPHLVYGGKTATEWDDFLESIGYPCFAVNISQDLGIHKSGFDGYHVCFTDAHSLKGLEAVFNGTVTSIHQIQAAEAALQSLIFYDQVVLLQPALGLHLQEKASVERFKQQDYGMWRPKNLPNTISNELLICENVWMNEGFVERSTLGDQSSLLRSDNPTNVEEYLDRTPIAAETLSVYPSSLGLPAFFSDPALQKNIFDLGLTGDLYRSVAEKIKERVEMVPGSKVEVRLPVLMWCLISRCSSRNDFEHELLELRDEFAFARAELSELDQIMNSAKSQREREDIGRHYHEAFEQVVTASRQSNFSYCRHVLYNVLKFYEMSPVARILHLLNPEWRPRNPDTLVQRSIAARSFKEIVDFKTVRSSIRSVFSVEEVAALEREAANRI